MKKYKVLNGIAEFATTNDILPEENLASYFTEMGIECLITDGYIEEIQEPEFTQREMKDRCVRFLENYSGYSLNNAIEIYDNWIKEKE